MQETLFIKTTFINDKYHARLYDKNSGSIIDEMACKYKCDTGYICSVMLRWADKLGYVSCMAQKSRERQVKKVSKPMGKIWYRKHLNKV